jgi:betaine-aldehyde dehydrogenase
MRDKHYIDGKWQQPSELACLDVYDPYREAILHRVSAGNAIDVDQAVKAALAALDDWKRAGGAGRAYYLRAIASKLRARSEELAQLSSANNGKPITEARIDVADAAASFAYYAEQAIALDERQNAEVRVPDRGFRARERFEPLGVAGLIVPWNFPLVTTSWKVAPALAAGCTAVLKPSEITPIVELELGAIVDEIGLPKGVLNIVVGTGELVGAPLTRHRGIAKVSFTGSNSIGQRVMAQAAAGTKAIGLELGGKSPILVFGDANVDLAIECVTTGIFFNAGQMCSATSRLIVDHGVAGKVIEGVVAAARALKIGDPRDEATQLGPLTTRAQYEKVMAYISIGRRSQLRLLAGGGRPREQEKGWFVEPTIFSDVDLASPLWREEIFGPVLCIRTFESEEEAVALANDSAFGLVATIITSDPERADRISEQLEVGHVWVNSPQVIFVETSWGGFKASGVGRELGAWGLSSYLGVKSTTTRL